MLYFPPLCYLLRYSWCTFDYSISVCTTPYIHRTVVDGNKHSFEFFYKYPDNDNINQWWNVTNIFTLPANVYWFQVSVISLLDYKLSVTASAKHIGRTLLLSTMKVFSCRFLTAFFTHLDILPFLQILSAQLFSNRLSHCGFFWPVKHQQWNEYSDPSRDNNIM